MTDKGIAASSLGVYIFTGSSKGIITSIGAGA
jgi:hypothetical protein